MTSLFLRMRS